MIDSQAVLTVFMVYIAGVLIPGPNFVAVVHKAVSDTRQQALALVAGIVVVNVFWASCAIGGISVVFAAFPWAALTIKLLGAAYLIWFGLRLLLKAGTGAAATPAQAAVGSAGRAFMQGVITNIGNPKSMAFFAAVFSSAAPAHASPGTFLSMLAVVAMVSSSWYTLVAVALSQPTVAAAYRRSKKTVDRLCGGLIVFLGIRQLAH
ncbi:threonine/homoserine/homoserine lactone efflux protein [Pseudomonas sp. JUb42]|jgi:threonine/homoserine/homoserine lactone efflux protein|uniref:LysE family translocator n=1 Tax=Pseudomonas sp. JUb42 TaxID=2940611 RepID=UPI0021692FF0|nr:LysE family translocator [Pseudomonas sp. JUb42]MCS3472708.1 threonine/homoserine/homoserine lactone efflux protein [Pseudomonas sp. JUb42]